MPESIRVAVSRGLRVSLNLLTHPRVTDDEDEITAMRAFLHEVPDFATVGNFTHTH